MMTARPFSNTRPVVRFNEVVQFDDDDSGSLSDEKIQVRIPLSSMEESRWLPCVDSPPSSPKTKKIKVASPDSKRKIMDNIFLSCPPMPPKLPTRWPSSRPKIAEKTLSSSQRGAVKSN